MNKESVPVRDLIEAGFSARGYHPEVTAVVVSGPHMLKAVEVDQVVHHWNSREAVTVFEAPKHVVAEVMQGNLDITGFMNDDGLPVEASYKKGGE